MPPAIPVPSTTTASHQYIVVREDEGVTRQYLHIPDTMKSWPWPRRINLHCDAVAAESASWFKALKPLSPRSLYAYDVCRSGVLVALAYPDISYEHLRVAADFMGVSYIVDEYTDVESALEVQQTVDIIIDALRYPDKPRQEGETVAGELTRQFWVRGRAIAAPLAAEHFINTFIEYLHSVAAQAEDRDNGTLLSIEDYMVRRRRNCGALMSFVMGVLHLPIPDEVFQHPVIKELENAASDLIVLDNDIISYNKEQATGDDASNILTTLMCRFQLDFDSVMEWVIGYHTEVQAQFLNALQRVPSFSPDVDPAVQHYIAGLANWPRAHVCWTFESGRYFGSRGPEVQKTGMVPLLPKHERNAELRRELVEIPIVEELEPQMPNGANRTRDGL